MYITGTYTSRKERLLEVMAKLKDSIFVPSPEVKDPTEVEKAMEEFSKQKFTIGMCGQIKAGKSTLLNYLLFDSVEILPTDVNTCTDNLTKITYGPENKVVIHFYTKNEWEELRKLEVQDSSGKVVNYYKKYLKDEVNKRADLGIFPEEVLGKTAEFKGSLLDIARKLKDYVSVTGKFSPFVSLVEIEANNDYLKDLVIVDTPGLNDPNRLRSQKTREFMSKAVAVIYLMYVGRAMDTEDYRFIDSVLTFTDSDKVLFAITKIDTHSEGYEDAKSYAEKVLKNDEKLKEKIKLPEKLEVYPISVMAAMLSKKLENGESLTEDDEYYLKIIPRDLIDKKGFLPEFISAIDEKIMKNKGRAIIHKWCKYIDGVMVAKIEELMHKKDRIRNMIIAYNKKLSEIESERDKLRSYLQQIEKKREAFEGEISRRYLPRIRNRMAQLLDDIVKKTEDNVERYIDRESINEIYNGLERKVYFTLTENFKEVIDEFIEDIEPELENKFSSFYTDMKSLVPNVEILPIYLVPNTAVIREHISQKLKNDLNEQIVKSLKQRKLIFILDKKATKAKIKSKVHEVLYNVKTEIIRDQIWGEIKNEILSAINGFVDGIKDKISDITEDLQEVERKYNNKVEEVEKLKAESQSNDELLKKAEDERRLVLKSIGDICD